MLPPSRLFPSCLCVAALAAAWLLPVASTSAATIPLNPVADAYPKNSTPTANSGGDPTIIANNGNGVRLAFLRFDLSAIDPSTIASLKLEMTVTTAYAKGFNVYGLVNGQNWVETGTGGLTWNNAPAVVTSFLTTPGTLSQYLKTADLYQNGQVLASFVSGAAAGSVDTVFNAGNGPVLDFVRADADRIVTFVIAEQDPADNSGTAWASREAAAGKPVLTVTTTEGYSVTPYLANADTYPRNSAATTPNGTATTIVANNANGIRVAFVRFNLGGVDLSTVTGLRMEMTVNLPYAKGFNVYGLVNGENWDEATMTWNNAPAVVTGYTAATGTLSQYLKTADLYGNGQVLASFASGASAGTVDVAFDVASGPVFDFITADADRVVTFVVAEQDPSDTGGVAWNSREAATGQPVLKIQRGTPPQPPDPPVPPRVIEVVLQGGQSNSDGRAAGSGLPAILQQPQADVPFYYYTFGAAANGDGTLGQLTTLRPGATQMPAGGFGPEVTLGSTLSGLIRQSPGHGLAIIKYAKGGSTLISDWKAGGDATTTGDGTHYVAFQRTVTAGLAKLAAAYPTSAIKVVGMIWVQGESDIDAGAAAVNAYGANLTTFIADVRATFGAGLPFFLSQISSSQTVYSNPSDPDYPNYLIIRQQQANVAAMVPGAYLVSADGPEFTMNSDFLHFNAGGQQALGAAFARRMDEVVGLRTTVAPDGAGSFTLTWNPVPGRTYSVQTSVDLQSWTTQAVGTTNTWTDPTPGASEEARFYRVQEDDPSGARPAVWSAPVRRMGR